MKRKRRSNPYPNERPADLIFWFRNGSCGGYCARVKACREVSIGRTDSKRGLGFIVSWGRRTRTGLTSCSTRIKSLNWPRISNTAHPFSNRWGASETK